ncbi:zinc finger, CCHC-type containing protein [Tanacetum coccineum]
MDVKTTFLNSKLDEEVYMNQPHGFIMPGNENKVCKLIKSLYGLKQAPTQWHQKFDEVVLSSGYLLNQVDKCVYSKFDEFGKGVIICLYVDDMLIFGTDQAQVNLINEFLSSRFSMKDMGRLITPMDTSEKLMPNNGQAISKLKYSRVIGCLMYAMTCTRPDIAFAVGKLSRPILRIHQGRYGVSVPALTKDRIPQDPIRRIQERQYAVFKLYGNKILWKISNVVPTPRNPQYGVSKTLNTPSITQYGVSTSIGYGVSNFLSNTSYSINKINTTYSLLLNTAYRSSETEAEFSDYKHNDALSGTHGEDAVEHIEYFLKIVDPINLPNVNQDKLRIVVFPISLAGDAWRWFDRIKGSITNPDLLTKDIEGFKTYEEYKDDWIYEWNENVPWVHEKPWTGIRWPTYRWKEDGYCNGGNLPGAYIVGNTLCYQDLEWYDTLKDSELKNEALRNKAIMEGLIDEDDESSNNGWRKWDGHEITDHDQEGREYENGHEDMERCELFDDHELPVCYIRRFKMIKYSFGDDEEYVAIKEDEYDDLTSAKKMHAEHTKKSFA